VATPRLPFTNMSTAIILTLVLLTDLFGASAPVADKITAEEVVAKHIEAIGSAEPRKTNRSRSAFCAFL
jgi:hypothetical protein